MKKNNISLFPLIALYFIFLTGCKKSSYDEYEQPIAMELSFFVDNSPLSFNAINYGSAAENKFSVSKLHLFLSYYKLENSDGTIYSFEKAIYMNASTNTALLIFQNFHFKPLT